METKFNEAERLYLTSYKEDCRRSERDASYAYSILELASCAVFLLNRFDDAIKLSCRALHGNFSKSALSNLSAVIERFAAHAYHRPGSVTRATADLIEFCTHFLESPRLHNKSSQLTIQDRLKTMKVCSTLKTFVS